MKLGDIAEIQTGLVLSRKRADTSLDTVREYHVLTLKSLDEDGVIDKNDFDQLNAIEELPDKYITQKNDVVIRLSEPNTAIHIDSELKGLVIPSHFIVIRLNDYDKVKPRFLTLYLNSKEIKYRISRFQMYSTIRRIKKSFLSNLEISDISMTNQEILINISKLHFKEKKLMCNLIKEKEKLYNNILSIVLNDREETVNGKYS